MTWNRNEEFKSENRGVIEREIVKNESEEKIKEFHKLLDNALLLGIGSSGDTMKGMEELRKIIKDFIFWDSWQGKKFADATERRVLLNKINDIKTKFWLE